MFKILKNLTVLLGIAAMLPLFAPESLAKEKKLTIIYSSAANGYLLPCG